MKILSLIFILTGMVIILSVFLGYSLTFWKTVKFILGCGFIYAGFNPEQTVKIKKGNKEILLQGKDAEKAIDDILETQEGLIFKFMKKFHNNFRLKSLIFGLIAGIILILDSLNLINTNLNFWEIILLIIGAGLISSGISKIFLRGK
ncbi:hypothetical protein X275_04060 [Marinitoga sp. 1197]|uniref:hypothetical protein n=1 Tax=Marinitoga sp. 1197 TaxID=1428449 RepID=UPI0006415D67|nr:hypothetical protein [Marinitoga sp. 1197]KLO23125.1 hypothetical protein X275_04060 [Marinitoga sp. 1197]